MLNNQYGYFHWIRFWFQPDPVWSWPWQRHSEKPQNWRPTYLQWVWTDYLWRGLGPTWISPSLAGDSESRHCQRFWEYLDPCWLLSLGPRSSGTLTAIGSRNPCPGSGQQDSAGWNCISGLQTCYSVRILMCGPLRKRWYHYVQMCNI